MTQRAAVKIEGKNAIPMFVGLGICAAILAATLIYYLNGGDGLIGLVGAALAGAAGYFGVLISAKAAIRGANQSTLPKPPGAA